MRLTALLSVPLLATMAVFLVNAPSAQAQQQKTVTVQRGDTLSAIAYTHGSTVNQIAGNNPGISNPDLIFPGQRLRVTGSRSTSTNGAVSASANQATATRAAANTANSIGSVAASTWERLAQCESGGDWSINTGNGFFGGLQFTMSSWQAVGGSGYPHHASKSEQINRAKKLQDIQGWGAWPACSANIGLL